MENTNHRRREQIQSQRYCYKADRWKGNKPFYLHIKIFGYYLPIIFTMTQKTKLTQNQLYKIKAILRYHRDSYKEDYAKGIDKIIIKLLKMVEELNE